MVWEFFLFGLQPVSHSLVLTYSLSFFPLYMQSLSFQPCIMYIMYILSSADRLQPPEELSQLALKSSS